MPDQHQLFEGLRGNTAGNPLCRAAAQLMELHQLRQAGNDDAAELDRRRAVLVASVDRWVASHTPRVHHGAPVHAEGLGSLIDRIAAAAASAFELLMSGGSAGQELRGRWWVLAELELAYGDFVADVSRGWRRLPIPEQMSKGTP